MRGYTPRESEFLALVQECGGYFIRRQFWPARGGRSQDLCEKLIARGHARQVATKKQTQVFQLAASGRRQESRLIRRCLMRLDYAIENPLEPIEAAYIDVGPGTSPSFRTWLEQRLTTERVFYVTERGDDLGVERARRIFAASTGPNGRLLRYFRLRQLQETDGLLGRSQAELNQYRNLRRLYQGETYEAMYQAWKDRTLSATCPVFRAVILDHNYDLFRADVSNGETAAAAG